MIYRPYGKTGKNVSVIGFGGMRFQDVDNSEACTSMMVEAAEGGINYFDTAPKYFGPKSEIRYGEGLAELRKRNLPHYISTKTFESTPDGIKREIEGQLERLGVDTIDFYHIWCITNLANWEERKQNGVLETFIDLKEQGLINHICVSSHLIGDEIKELLQEKVFEGVLFGYSAYNFQTRQAAFDAITQHKLGAVVMNPLGGGLIPQNPELFDFLKTGSDETVVEAALRFLIAHEQITTALVGFGNSKEVQDALKAVEGYKEISADGMNKIKAQASDNFKDLCTGCQYCDNCPEDIQIPKFMDAYNHKILYQKNDPMTGRMKYHWSIDSAEAAKCVECGACETDCTQHLPIIDRLKEIAALGV